MVMPARGVIYSLNDARQFDWPQGLRRYIDDIRQGRGQHPKQYSARYVCSLGAPRGRRAGAIPTPALRGGLGSRGPHPQGVQAVQGDAGITRRAFRDQTACPPTPRARCRFKWLTSTGPSSTEDGARRSHCVGPRVRVGPGAAGALNRNLRCSAGSLW